MTKMPEKKSLAEAVELSGLKHKFIAQKVGVDPSAFSRYLSGERKPSVDTIKKIAKVLRVPFWTIK